MGGIVDETEPVCLSGPACKQHDGRQPYPTSQPLCHDCLDAAARDTRALPYDYLDLAQLHEASLSQAVNEHTSGSHESPMLIAGHVEALQAEIVYVLSVWEHELRTACNLHDPGTYAPLWRTPVYDHLDLVRRRPTLRRARPGAVVQRAVDVIAPRVGRLAALPETVVCPTGIEDQPTPIAGWAAVHQLQQLHSRARGMLGRTTRRFWIPGDCWTCTARARRGEDGPLYRSEPRFEGDPMQVNCDRCAAYRQYADYEYALANLGMWPDHDLARFVA